MMTKLSYALIASCVALVTGCATEPPKQQDNACLMLKENRHWYKAMRKSSKRWGAPIGLQLAIVRQESSFVHDAKPARGDRRMLGLLPGKRPSSAYGYAQALDGTWKEYRVQTGRGGADRDEFDDAVDFIGWYVNRTGRMTGIGQFDYRGHYLAYHEGPNGYRRGTWKNKSWLINVANKVHSNATRYEQQIRSCHSDLKGGFLFF